MEMSVVQALLFTVVIIFHTGEYSVKSDIVDKCPQQEEVVPLLNKGLEDNEYKGWHATCQHIAFVSNKGQKL
tara:strand:- start:65 stop:280 length:216 start_codon:yes stop_codon:yes gene_type:complete